MFPLAPLVGLVIVVHSLTYSQIQVIPTLSSVHEYMLESKIRFPFFLKRVDQHDDEIVYFDPQAGNISILRYQQNGVYTTSRLIDTISHVTSMTVGDINNDGIDDIAAVQRDYSRVVLFISAKNDSAYQRRYFMVGFYPEHALIQDISGDARADLIVYGKLSSGVTVISGQGSNVFNETITIFTDVPVSSLSVIRLNGDDVPDVVVHNWLTNEDIFYFGLGNLQFSEQSALSYGADSTATLFEDVNNDGITDVVVASTQYQSILAYHSDGLGNFMREQSISLLGAVSSLCRTSFTRKDIPDILLTNNSAEQFSLLLNKQDGTFYDEIVFGIPYAHSSLISGDVNADGFTDIICFDEDSSRYTIYWHQSTVFTDSLPATFVVGKDPNNIYVTDINTDGFDDVLVSNGGSHTVSLLFGSAKGLSSQFSLETPDAPSSVTLYSKSDSALVLITSHGEQAKIGITTVLLGNRQSVSMLGEIESYTIGLSGKPSHILPDISLYNSSLSLYVFLRGQMNSIVFYQQLYGIRFIAKSLTPLIPSRIMFSTISDLNADGHTDLVYVYNDKQKNRELIGTTLNDEKGEFTGTTYTLALPDTGHRRSYLWVEDLNGDQQKDYIFYSYPQKTLNVILAKNAGEFTQLSTASEEVSLSHQDQLKFYDVDSDGVDDIVYSDTETMSIHFLRSRGNGTFYPAHPILQLSTHAPFSCGDIDGDGTMDIVFPHQQKNSIEVHYGKKY